VLGNEIINECQNLTREQLFRISLLAHYQLATFCENCYYGDLFTAKFRVSEIDAHVYKIID